MPSALNVHCSATMVAISSVRMAAPPSQLKTIRMRSATAVTGRTFECSMRFSLCHPYRETINYLSFFGKMGAKENTGCWDRVR